MRRNSFTDRGKLRRLAQRSRERNQRDRLVLRRNGKNPAARGPRDVVDLGVVKVGEARVASGAVRREDDDGAVRPHRDGVAVVERAPGAFGAGAFGILDVLFERLEDFRGESAAGDRGRVLDRDGGGDAVEFASEDEDNA